MTTDPELARVLASLIPRPRTPADEINPACCTRCYEEWQHQQQIEAWRIVRDRSES